MWLDALVLTVLGIFALLGALRGALVAGMAVGSLIAAYGAAAALASSQGAALAGGLGLPELGGVALAGTGGFFVTYAALGAIARRIRLRRDHGMSGRSPRDRFLGAAFGALRGTLVALLLAYLAIWLDALRLTGITEVVPSVADSAAASVTESVVEAGVEAALSDAGPAKRLAARMAARPGVAFVEIQEVLAHPGVAALQDDRLFWSYVEHGAVDNALNQRSFVAVAHDGALKERLFALGFISEAAAGDPAVFREQAGSVLRQVGPRIRDLRNDPELRGLLDDPEVIAMLHSGNTLGLVQHAGFRRLVTRVTADVDESEL